MHSPSAWTRGQQLPAQLTQRILIMDGAMSTMIQQLQLSEQAWRGARFADWPGDLKGNNELLNLTQPAHIQAIHKAYLAAGANVIETDIWRHHDRPDRLRHGTSGRL